MNFSILPQKKKRLKALSEASKELNHKVFLVDDDEAILVASFAFRYNAEDFVEYMATVSKAVYTVVYQPLVFAPEPDKHKGAFSGFLGFLFNNSKRFAEAADPEPEDDKVDPVSEGQEQVKVIESEIIQVGEK